MFHLAKRTPLVVGESLVPAIIPMLRLLGVEEQVKSDLKVTIRCIPFDAPEEAGRCIVTGEPSKRRVVWGKSY